MRISSAFMLVLALALGGIAAFLARQFMEGNIIGPSTQNERTLVVAAQSLPFGTLLTADNVREISWPASHSLEGGFANKDELLKEGRRVVLVALQRDEPILSAKVTGPNQRASLSTVIEEGMRAVSVKMDEVRGVAGFIQPGDRVDVVLTRSDAGAANAQRPSMADVLLQNVKVLAIDQQADERQEKPTVARAVTLEVSIEQSQKIILAEGVGRLSLILRQAGEANSGDTKRVTIADLGLTEVVDGAKEAALRRIAELEARLKNDQPAKAQHPTVIALPKRDERVVVTVIRGISKRDEYSVWSERP